jgi:putative flippase GtrA
VGRLGPLAAVTAAAGAGRLAGIGATTLSTLKFLSTGGIATLVTVGLFNLLVHAGEHPLMAALPVPAYVIAIAAGMAVSYVGNRWWAFAHRSSRGVVRDLPAFVAINVVALAIPVSCLAVSRYALRAESALADNVSANIVGLVLATAFRYQAYRSWVFIDPASRGS